MQCRKSYFFAMVLLALLVTAAVSFWIVLPEPQADGVPAIARIIRRVVLTRPPEKMVWTDQDRTVQKQLETLLSDREPPMQMVFDGGKVMNGRVVEERSDGVVFAEQLGHSGEVSMAIDRRRIVSLEKREANLPEITLRDVRFHRTYPKLQFYIRPPFTIITEESFFAVERIVQQQQALYNQFIESFEPLINGTRRSGIQLLILSDSDEFELCRLRADGVKKGASGFYNIRENRLIVLHQRDAEWVKDGRRQIADAAAQQQKKMKTQRGQELLRRWKKKAHAQLDAQAGTTTRNILRHEGTHQLCYALGVLNPAEPGRGWVSEGLATYFETQSPGSANGNRVRELKESAENKGLLTLRELMSLKQCTSGIHYAQAWALANLMMQPEYRSGFFAYLGHIRKNPFEQNGTPAEELCRYLLIGPQELERRWMESIRAL